MMRLDQIRTRIDCAARRIASLQDDIAALEGGGCPGELQWKRRQLAAESKRLCDLRGQLRRLKRCSAAAVLAW